MYNRMNKQTYKSRSRFGRRWSGRWEEALEKDTETQQSTGGWTNNNGEALCYDENE